MQKTRINHCSLARKDTEQEQRELYAHGYIRKQLNAKNYEEKSKLLSELRSRPDYQEIKQILRELKGERD